MRQYVILGLMAIILFGCVSQPPAGNTSGGPPVISSPGGVSPNATQPAQPQTLPPDYTVSLGDSVWINYTVWDKGSVIDTNNATLANESGLYNPSRAYEPINFTVLPNQAIINGMITSIVGMHVGETLDFDVAPADGYGPYDMKKVIVIPRYYNMSLLEIVPRSYFADNNFTVENGTSFTDKQLGTVFVADLNDQNVTLFYLGIASHDQNFTYDGMPLETILVDNTTATLERKFEVNKSYIIPDPNTGSPTYFKAIGKTNDSITLDGNHPLANETLHFRVTLIKVQHGNLTLGSLG
jgi:peptidylprolyl isomerase